MSEDLSKFDVRFASDSSQGQIETMRKMIKKLQAEMDDLREMMEDELVEKSTLEKTNRKLMMELDDTSCLVTELREEIYQLKKRSANVSIDNNSKDEAIRSTQPANDNLNEEEMILKRSIEEMKRELTNLDLELEHTSIEYQQMMKRTQSMEEECGDLTEQIEIEKVNMDKSSRNIQILESEINELMEEVDKPRGKNNDYSTNNDKMIECENLRIEIMNLQSKVKETQVILEDSSVELKRLVNSVEDLENSVEMATEDILSLKKVARELQLKRDDFSKSNNNTTSYDLLIEKKNLEDQLNQRKDELNEIIKKTRDQKSLMQLANKLDDLACEYDDTNAHNSRLQKKKLQLEREKEKLLDELQPLKSQSDVKILNEYNQLKKEKDVLAKQIKMLEKEIGDISRKRKNIVKRSEELREKLQNSKEEENKLENEIEETNFQRLSQFYRSYEHELEKNPF